MTEQLQLRRGTATQIAAFTGAQGEVVVDTTNNRAVVNDGSTAGGWPAAKLSEVIANTRMAVFDAAYAALASDRSIAFTALTAARVVTLPASSAYPTGTRLTVFDESGSCSASLTIILNAAGSDKIDGASSAVISNAYGFLALQSSGTGKWTIVDQSTLAMAQQAPGAVAITGGAIDGTVIGATTPSAASVTAPAAGNSSARAITSAWFGQNLPGGFVNRFRNGTIDVWQRGTSFSCPANAYTMTTDGWLVSLNGTGAATADRFTQGGKNVYGLRITGATGNTNLTLTQKIESAIAQCMVGQTVTLQMLVLNETGGTITPTFSTAYANSQDNFGAVTGDTSGSFQACPNATWSTVAATFNVSGSATDLGYLVNIGFGNVPSGYIVVGNLDIRVTPGVATGLNANPPPPETRPIAIELAFCQRYFALLGNGVGFASAATNAYVSVQFPTPMRVAPTLALLDPSTTMMSIPGSAAFAASALTAFSPSTQGVMLGLTSSGMTANAIIILIDSAQNISASAEL